MKLDKEKIAAIRLQELGLQLQGILGEINSIINAPAKTSKINKKEAVYAKREAIIAKREARKANR